MFEFHDPGRLIDDDLELVLTDTLPGDDARQRVPAYRFDMQHAVWGMKLGLVELRIGSTRQIEMYAGHFGYRVVPRSRGRRYAARACRLLIPLARSHGLEELWITCSPENEASKRTCELAGAVLVEIVDLPSDSDMYRRGDRQKCRYRLEVCEDMSCSVVPPTSRRYGLWSGGALVGDARDQFGSEGREASHERSG